VSGDRIEKRVTLEAPLARVWRAVSDAREFGSWFGVAFDGPFVAGRELTGKIVPTTADPEVAKLQKPHEGKPFAFVVERIEPMRRISFRWHPFAIEPGKDYSKEPMTLVVFTLAEVAGGTELVVTRRVSTPYRTSGAPTPSRPTTAVGTTRRGSSGSISLRT
jgi:uncharacterized protein YndB with AHSA1/START domain